MCSRLRYSGDSILYIPSLNKFRLWNQAVQSDYRLGFRQTGSWPALTYKHTGGVLGSPVATMRRSVVATPGRRDVRAFGDTTVHPNGRTGQCSEAFFRRYVSIASRTIADILPTFPAIFSL